jgi:tetratricopeptide (TPR) repeat protein
MIAAQYEASVEDDREAAMRIYRELLEKYPREKYAWSYLGRLYGENGIFREGIACQERALELDPAFRPALNELAYSYLRMENHEKAMEIFRRYSALYPGDANPYDSMGEAYFGMGSLDEAARMYEKAFALKPLLGSAVMLAYLSGMRGDFREGLSWIEKDMRREKLSGELVVDYVWRAAYHLYLDDFDEAMEDARRAFALADSTGNTGMMGVAIQAQGAVLFGWGRLEEAREISREAPRKERQSHRGARALREVPRVLAGRRPRSPRAHRREGARRGARILPELKRIDNLADIGKRSKLGCDRSGRGNNLAPRSLARLHDDLPPQERKSLREKSHELLVRLPLVRRSGHPNTKLPGCVSAEELVSRG